MNGEESTCGVTPCCPPGEPHAFLCPNGVQVPSPALPTDRLEQVIDSYLEDYEMVGEAEDGRDACHVPTEGERILIKDAILGLLANDEWDAAWGELIEQRARERATSGVTGHQISGSKNSSTSPARVTEANEAERFAQELGFHDAMSALRSLERRMTDGVSAAPAPRAPASDCPNCNDWYDPRPGMHCPQCKRDLTLGVASVEAPSDEAVKLLERIARNHENMTCDTLLRRDVRRLLMRTTGVTGEVPRG